jgi:hypothetical protein
MAAYLRPFRSCGSRESRQLESAEWKHAASDDILLGWAEVTSAFLVIR